MAHSSKTVTFDFSNMKKPEFDFWNHYCNAQHEIMRVEHDNITFYKYNFTEEELPEWYENEDNDHN